MKDGINIELDAAEKQMVPDDLNSLAVGSYNIPNPIIRNRYFYIFMVLAIISVLITTMNNWINLYPAAILLFLMSLFIKFIENKKIVKQKEIIEIVSKYLPHSIGYYSVALTFNFSFQFKLLSPIWTVIVYDHNNPPKQKSIIEFDALTEKIISDVYTEDVVDA
ncbi:MAG: hypothetical protein VYD43_01890 [Actinomycetota bacterium]|nr:hypothetical protein [Actinomycetota bacterium]